MLESTQVEAYQETVQTLQTEELQRHLVVISTQLDISKIRLGTRQHD